MHVPKPWLEQLTLDKLHRLAVLIGTPCSGTKAARISGIQDAMMRDGSTSTMSRRKTEGRPLSLVSIDMGIRNLAYAHLRGSLPHDTTTSLANDEAGRPLELKLETWRRLSIADDRLLENSQAEDEPASSTGVRGKTVRESFEPIDYARHAYNLVKMITETHNPTHILIERQRFRSGGHASVQEWTIRVGVFEGMIYAVLRALMANDPNKYTVVPMLPAQVNRFWLGSLLQQHPPLKTSTEKIPTRTVKKMKVDLVASLLDGSEEDATRLVLSNEAQKMRAEFLAKYRKEKSVTTKIGEGLLKLDDLADSLLQGLAWIEWEKNRQRLRMLGEAAFDLN